MNWRHITDRPRFLSKSRSRESSRFSFLRIVFSIRCRSFQGPILFTSLSPASGHPLLRKTTLPPVSTGQRRPLQGVASDSFYPFCFLPCFYLFDASSSLVIFLYSIFELSFLLCCHCSFPHVFSQVVRLHRSSNSLFLVPSRLLAPHSNFDKHDLLI